MKKSISIVLGVIFLIIGCQVVDKIQYTSIAEIINNSREYENKIVSIKGVVVSIENYMVVKAFKITDASGSITVSTKKLLPDVGQTIAIKGIVKVSDVPVYGKAITIEEIIQ